jgi:hypothetical protein
MTKYLTTVLFVSLATVALAQDRLKTIAFEIGGDLIGCQAEANDFIRDDTPTTRYWNSNTSNRFGVMHRLYAGAKLEGRFKNEKFSVGFGARLSRLEGIYSKANYRYQYDQSQPSEFFYFVLNLDATTTELLRVKAISQPAYYLGVPIEFRFIPFEKRRFKAYVKVSTDFNFKLQSSTNVDFVDDGMKSMRHRLPKE